MRLPGAKSISTSRRWASASKCALTTVHGGGRPSACCISVVSFKPAPSASSLWGPSRSSLAPCSPPSRTLRAAQARWPSAILDRGCARRLGVVRPGRRNGPFRPNQETSQVGRALPSSKGLGPQPTPNGEEALRHAFDCADGSIGSAIGDKLLELFSAFHSDLV